jgi:DNA primase
MALYTSREVVMSAISALGFKVFQGGKFHWNSERTPDSSINANGTVHRWTDGWHGDLIDFIREVKSCNFREAKELAEKLTGAELNSSFEAWKPIEEKKSSPIDKSYLSQFAIDRKKFFNKYIVLLKKLLPSVKSYDQLKAIGLKYHIGYIAKSNRLHIPIFDTNGDWITSAKYSPIKKGNLPKILFTKGRAKIPFNLQDLLKFDKSKTLLVLEGHKDVLNAIANGYQAVTSGGAGDLFREQDLSLFKGFKKVVIVGDNDKAGLKFNERISSQLNGIVKNIVIWDWELLSLQTKQSFKKGFDFTDWLEKINKN